MLKGDWWVGGGLEQFSVSPRPLGFWFGTKGFGAYGLGPGLDNLLVLMLFFSQISKCASSNFLLQALSFLTGPGTSGTELEDFRVSSSSCGIKISTNCPRYPRRLPRLQCPPRPRQCSTRTHHRTVAPPACFWFLCSLTFISISLSRLLLPFVTDQNNGPRDAVTLSTEAS